MEENIIYSRERICYFSLYSYFTNPSLSSHLEAKAWGDGFFNGSWKLFFTRTLPSLLFCIVVFPFFFLLQKEVIWLGCGKQKRREKGDVKALNVYQLLSCYPSLPFLFMLFAFYIDFFYTLYFRMLG